MTQETEAGTKVLSEIIFDFDGEKVPVKIHGEKNGFAYTLKRKSLPNYKNMASDGVKIGVKAAKEEDGTIYIYERVSLRKNRQPFKMIGKFKPTRVEANNTRVVYWTKKWYGDKVLSKVEKRYETVPF